MDDLVQEFERFGFEPAKTKEIIKNKKVANALSQILKESGLGTSSDKTVITLLHGLASLSKDATGDEKRYLLSKAIADGKVKTNIQLDAGWKYLKEARSAADTAEFEEAAGVGKEVSKEEVEKAVAAYFEANKKDIEEKRYKAISSIMAGVKALPELKWANPSLFKPIIDAKMLELLGPKDERDAPKKKEKPAKDKAKPKEKLEKVTTPGASVRSMFAEGFLGALHKPGENPQAYPELMEEHLKATGGKVFTRFPPEPNGYLHIGHSKAILVNFGYAKFHGGHCYLRYDDTNPEAEEEQYFVSIKDTVSWLGFEPYKVTYSSDYFDRLYELAEFLIQQDKGYVCFCTPEEVKRNRGVTEDGGKGGKRVACRCRSKTPAENLIQFREMRDGKYKVGEATLRMKQDLDNPNPQMWDLVAYRVLNAPHHRTGDQWKIYPTYDFTHCLVDSFENITHSLCTTEFYLSRESYEWLCDAVHVYRPAQREYGRLNITGTVLSKRKIQKLVTSKIVRGWDDPRLFTLVAIRRRGVPPGAILSFVASLGVTTSNSNIQVVRFESAVRKYLEDTTPRLMLVLDPVPVILENLPDDYVEEIEIPFKPDMPAMGTRKVPFTKKIYIDRSDFREERIPGDDFFRLMPDQPVGLLKVPFNIAVTSVKKDSTGKVVEIYAKYLNDGTSKKPKTYIQWVPESPAHKSPVKLAEVRTFSQLFKSENPSAHPDGFLADVNPNSEHITTGAVIEPAFYEVKQKSPWPVPGAEDENVLGKDVKGAPEAVRFQALRVGYFCLDKDATEDSIVLNRIVSLKE